MTLVASRLFLAAALVIAAAAARAQPCPEPATWSALDGERPRAAQASVLLDRWVAGVMGSGRLRHGHGVPHQLRDLGMNNVGILLPHSADGDRIVEMSGRPVQKTITAVALVRLQPPGTWLPLRVKRGGETLDLVVKFPPDKP